MLCLGILGEKMTKGDNDSRNINLMSKFIRKLCRKLAKSVFPNKLRIFLLRQAGVKIGRDVVINEGFTLICSFGYEQNLIVEDRVAMGPNVTIIVTSHPNFSKLRNLKKLYPFIEVRGSVHIEKDAWIGTEAIILPNITIGKSSIVGAGSVVTKDVDPFSVVAGNPAKIIRMVKLPKDVYKK